MSASTNPFSPELALLPGLLEARKQLDQMIERILRENGLDRRTAAGFPPAPTPAPRISPTAESPLSQSKLSADRLSPEGRRKIQEAQKRRWARAHGEVGSPGTDQE